MTRALTLQGGLGLLLGAAGLTLLLRPGVARLGASEQARYASRILGAMLFAGGLFLAGFAIAFQLAMQP